MRVLDTREPTLGGADGKVGAGRTVAVDVSTAVPPGASAVALTVTAVDPCAAGFLTVFDCGVRPMTSNVNYVPGRNTAGLVFVPPDAAGRVCVATLSTTDIVVDVIGSFGDGGSRFSPLGPTRWIDTRGGPSLLGDVRGVRVGGQDTTVQIAGDGGVPADATAAWINLTIADPTAPTVLTAYPGPCATAPTASTVNARAASPPQRARSSGWAPTDRSACTPSPGPRAWSSTSPGGSAPALPCASGRRRPPAWSTPATRRPQRPPDPRRSASPVSACST